MVRGADQLKREEKQSGGDSGTNEESTEWSEEDKELLREEKAEVDDWWFS